MPLLRTDLHPLNEHNRIFKFADDTHLGVPAVATGTYQSEIKNLQARAADNLKLNRGKTKEIVF